MQNDNHLQPQPAKRRRFSKLPGVEFLLGQQLCTEDFPAPSIGPIVVETPIVQDIILGLQTNEIQLAPAPAEELIPSPSPAIKRARRSTTCDGKRHLEQIVSDEVTLQKQHRRIKNRQAARKFRIKQKEYVHELERQVACYIYERSQINDRVRNLERENKLLTEQLSYLRDLINPGVLEKFQEPST